MYIIYSRFKFHSGYYRHSIYGAGSRWESIETKFKFFIALSFTTYQHYTIYNINNNIHIYRAMYMMMVESD